ncbi:MAG: site-specific integrase [Crocinitomicaceae bacterium]|nr:site-specific integrase [Crocinitomicaceae bacterium]
MKRTFRQYLETKNYQPFTIHTTQQTVKKYRHWLKENNTSAYRVTHSIAMQYVGYLNKKHKPQVVNQKLAHIRHYYNFLVTTKHPFTDIKVLGSRKKTLLGLLSENELRNLYLQLPETTDREVRTKVLAGFYIFQGVSTRDIAALRVSHVILQEGRVIIPQTRRGNSRTLALDPIQMMLLINVLTDKPPQDLIYQTLAQAKQRAYIIDCLHSDLKNYPPYKSLRHIRHSVVMNWLKTCNLRQVQYNAGHRYISTTEKYIQSDYEGLKLAIIDKHPMG